MSLPAASSTLVVTSTVTIGPSGVVTSVATTIANGSGESGAGALSTGAITAIAVTIPAVATALLIGLGVFFWKQRRLSFEVPTLGVSKTFKTTADKLDRILLNTWAVEISAVTLSAACFTAIAAVLLAYHGKSEPELPYGVTLNAIIAVLSTGARSALICAVGGALGQLKWIWFQKSRKLEDIQLFDEAERGPWGAVALLGSLNVEALASIGALITILALAVDPFSQQVLRYPQVFVAQPDFNATATQRPVFRLSEGYDSFYRAMKVGQYAFDDDFENVPSCPSHHCEWTRLRSAGLCSICTDARPNATLGECGNPAFWANATADSTCTLSFGHGNSVNLATRKPPSGSFVVEEVVWRVGGVHVPLTGETSPNHVSHESIDTFAGISQPGLVLGHARVSAQQSVVNNESYVPKIEVAQECALTHCITNQNLSTFGSDVQSTLLDVEYGSYKIEHLRSDGNDSSSQLESYVCWQAIPGPVQYEWSLIPGKAQIDAGVSNYGWANRSLSAVCAVDGQLDAIREAVSGANVVNCSQAPVNSGGGYQCDAWDPRDSSLAAFWHASKSLNSTLMRIAASLNKLNLGISNDEVTGIAYLHVVYVQVSWAWLVLPAALEVLGIVFLITAMLQTKRYRVRLWKSSVLPLLFHGLDKPTLQVNNAPPDVWAMKKVAETIEVRLGAARPKADEDLFPPWDYDVSEKVETTLLLRSEK